MEEFTLAPGERIVIKVRIHPFVLFSTLLPYIILALAPFFLVPLLSLVAAGGWPNGSSA